MQRKLNEYQSLQKKSNLSNSKNSQLENLEKKKLQSLINYDDLNKKDNDDNDEKNSKKEEEDNYTFEEQYDKSSYFPKPLLRQKQTKTQPSEPKKRPPVAWINFSMEDKENKPKPIPRDKLEMLEYLNSLAQKKDKDRIPQTKKRLRIKHESKDFNADNFETQLNSTINSLNEKDKNTSKEKQLIENFHFGQINLFVSQKSFQI